MIENVNVELWGWQAFNKHAIIAQPQSSLTKKVAWAETHSATTGLNRAAALASPWLSQSAPTRLKSLSRHSLTPSRNQLSPRYLREQLLTDRGEESK